MILAPAIGAAVATAVLIALATASRPVPVGPERASAAIRPGPASGTTRGPTRAVSVTVGQATGVDFQGVSGQLTVVAADTGQVTLTGRLDWKGHAPIMVTRLNRGTHVLLISSQCAAASPCTEHYRLTVPRDAAVTLRQPPGQIMLSGLAGPLRISARHVYVVATGLRSSTLLIAITSGDLSAGFAGAPSRISVTLVSAHATLRLPRGVAYRVSQQVISGYVQADIPQDSAAGRTLDVRIRSGELALLPS